MTRIVTDSPTITWDESTPGQITANVGGDQSGGFYLDTEDANIVRLADRVFVGEAVDASGNRNGSQDSILPTSTEGANWALRGSQLLSIASQGGLAVTGISRSNDSAVESTIGVSGFVVNDKASGSAWGLYSDIQHESGASFSTGLEVAAKNKGSDISGNPYAMGGGVSGIWLAGGGDNAYGGSAANPGNAAVGIIKNDDYGWNVGILFEKDALTGATGSSGAATAIAMGYGHRLSWFAADATGGSGAAASVRADMTLGSNAVSQVFADNAVSWVGSTGNRFLQARFGSVGVNFVDIVSGATTAAPTIAAAGTDTNIDLALSGKGSGNVVVSTSVHAHNATAVPAGGTAGAGIKLSSTANLGVFFGSGVPTLSAAQGSLYLRTDGSSTSTRAYINTNGSTTWTAVTTAA